MIGNRWASHLRVARRMRPLAVLAVVAVLSVSSSQVANPAPVDVQAARACLAYFGYYNDVLAAGLPPVSAVPPGERAQLVRAYAAQAKIHVPTAAEVRSEVRPLAGTRWSDLGANLVAAVDTGVRGFSGRSAPEDPEIDAACNRLSIAAKVDGGWVPDS